MTSAHVVETSVTNNSSFQIHPHPDDHTIRTTDTPEFKPFTIYINLQKELDTYLELLKEETFHLLAAINVIN